MNQRLFFLLSAISLFLAPSASAFAQLGESSDDGVAVHRDLEFATSESKRLLLDVFTPASKPGEPRPLIVWVHGGAWRAGNKNNCPAVGFVAKGYVVASISYRLSQDAIYPAQIEDCKAAIRWLRAHADAYGIDPDRVGVWGASAGGHLAALLGTTGDVPELEQQHDHRDQSSRVQAVCNFFGPTDFLRMQQDSLPNGPIRHDSSDSPESKLIGGPVQEHPEKVALANPITYVTQDDPPFLIVHGDRDPLVPWQQSKYLYEALVQAQNPDASLHVIKGAGHGFGSNAEVSLLVENFFEKHLKSRSSTDQLVAQLEAPLPVPKHLRELFDRMEAANRRSQDVFRALTVKQMNFKPSDGTHTPRWNAEHMAGRQLLFFSQIYNAIDPSIPVVDRNPKQMPDVYEARHPDWSGADEARAMQRVDNFCRHYAHLLKDTRLNDRPPATSWPSLAALLLQMERHYDEHTANVKKKFELSDWPQE